MSVSRIAWFGPCLVITIFTLVTLLGTAYGQTLQDEPHAIMAGITYSSRSNKPTPSLIDRNARIERRRPVMVPIRSHMVPLSPSYNYDGTRENQQPPGDTSLMVFPDRVRTYGGSSSSVSGHGVSNFGSEVSGHRVSEDNRATAASGGASIEVPADLDLNKLNLDEMRALSNAETIEDFARMLGMDLPEPTIFDDSDGIAARFGSGKAGNTVAQSAGCKPEEKVVHLALPVELNVIYFPRCVRLQRCGGCCTGPLLKCRPQQVEPVTLQVLRVENSGGYSTRSANPSNTRRDGSSSRRPSRRRTSNRRRRQASRYHTVQEENHVTCACKCRVQKEDCVPQLQEYVAEECQCRCKNSDEKAKCDALSSTHYWDPDTCKCYCLKTHSCSTGQYFDHASCSCKQVGIELPGDMGIFGLAPRFGGPVNPGPRPENVGGRSNSLTHIPVTFGLPH